MAHNDTLKAIYYDPKQGLLSKTKFIQKVKQFHPNIPIKDIEDFVKKQELQQVNQKTQFKGFYKIVAPPRHFQVDIFFLSPYKRSNNNYSMFLHCIDILSRKMFVYPIKNHNVTTIIEALNTFIKDAEVKGIAADDEFSAQKIVEFCEKHKIRLITDVAKDDHISRGNKLGIVDIATRTIKRYIRNYMLANDTTKFINHLPDLVANYNNTPHTSLRNLSPNDVWDDIGLQQKMYESLTKHNQQLTNKVDLDIGDYVRKRVDKGKFDKENATFSSEIFVIVDDSGHKYIIQDADGKTLERRFKYHELIKVNPVEVEGKLKQNTKKQVEQTHITTKKVMKELGTSYGDANRLVQRVIKRKPKKAIVTEANKRLDLFDD